MLPFQDTDLEKLYVFARHLRSLVIIDREELPREVQQNIDLDSYALRETMKGGINLDRGQGTVDPQAEQGAAYRTTGTAWSRSRRSSPN